jgi:hypothetical protein
MRAGRERRKTMYRYLMTPNGRKSPEPPGFHFFIFLKDFFHLSCICTCTFPLGIASYKKIRLGMPTYRNVPKTYQNVPKRTGKKLRAPIVVSSNIYFSLFGTFSCIFRDKKRVGFDIIKKPIDISNLCGMSHISHTVNCIILKYLLT